MALRFKGFTPGSAVAILAELGAASDSASVDEWGTAPSGTSTFTVTVSADPTAGEAVFVAVDGAGGWPVADEKASMADISVWIDYGDPGSTFRSPRGKGATNANLIRGRVSGHVYATPGTKTITIHSKMRGQAARSQTVTINVRDPDTEITWTQTWYVDLTGNSTGFPAVSSSVSHILSSAQWWAKNNSVAGGTNIRIMWRADTTHELVYSGESSVRLNAAYVRIEKFGSGADPIINITGTYATPVYFYWPRVVGQRIAMLNFDLRGGYDPVEGIFNGPAIIVMNGQNNSDTSVEPISLWRVKASGISSLVQGLASTRTCGVIDCDVSDWHDYGIGQFAGGYLAIIGNSCKQHPLAVSKSNDGKTGDQRQQPDHGPFRASYFYRLGIVANDTANGCGWSGLAAPEVYDQAIWRFARDADQGRADPGTLVASIYDNEGRGTDFVSANTPNENSVVNFPWWVIVEGNLRYGTRSSFVASTDGHLATTAFGGLIIQNNVTYQPALVDGDGRRVGGTAFKAYPRQASTQVIDGNPIGTKLVSLAVHQQPNVVRNNTLLTDHVGSWDLEVSNVDGAPEFGTIDEADNILSGPGLTNGGSFPPATALSRGDDFRAITGSAADADSSGTPPCFDFDFVERVGATNIGAHHTTGANVVPPVPVYSGSGLTIELVTKRLDTLYQVTDLDLTNWTDLDPYLIEWRWLLGAAESPNATQTHLRFFVSGPTGSLQCEISAVGLGNVRETALSNTLAT